jgi:hypothetical protein
MNSKLILAFLALAAASMACGFDIPKMPTPGPEITDEIAIPIPDADEASYSVTPPSRFQAD